VTVFSHMPSRARTLAGAVLLAWGGTAAGQTPPGCDQQIAEIEGLMQQQGFHPQVETELRDLLAAAQQADDQACLDYVAHAQTLLRNVRAGVATRAEPDPPPQPEPGQPLDRPSEQLSDPDTDLRPLDMRIVPELEVEQEEPEVRIIPEDEEQHRS
jgi:hypothetical protein